MCIVKVKRESIRRLNIVFKIFTNLFAISTKVMKHNLIYNSFYVVYHLDRKLLVSSVV